MEEQFNREEKEGWRDAADAARTADAARITDEMRARRTANIRQESLLRLTATREQS